MAITNLTRSVPYTGDGSTRVFSYSPMTIFQTSDLSVWTRVTATGVETEILEGTSATTYSVSITNPNRLPSIGTISYPAVGGTLLPSTSTIVIRRGLANTQLVEDEDALDKLTMLVLQHQEILDRCLKVPITEPTATNMDVNSGDVLTAGEYLRVNSGATGFDMAAQATTTGTASDAAPANISSTTAAAGSGTDFSRNDHVHTIPATTFPLLSTENVFTESQVWFKGTDVASASTPTLGAGNIFDITGTTTITDITSIGVGTPVLLHFDGILELTHDGVDLVLPGNESITTAAGDEICIYEHIAGEWRVLSYNANIPVRMQRSVDPSQKVVFFDDFIGTISTPISSTAGSGTGNAAATISAGAGGRITLTSASDDGAHSANCSTLSLDTLDWRADQGDLVLQTRLQIDDVSEAVLFVGFTDTISTTVELPIYKTLGADTIDSDATDACGIGYDIDGTTDEWFHGGVDSGVDTAATHSGSAPTDGTYVELRVEVTAAGAVRGWVNGTAIGAATASAVTTTTPLTPMIVIGNRSANQVIATIDYFWASADR